MLGGSPTVLSGRLFELYGHTILRCGNIEGLECRELVDESNKGLG